MKCYCPKCGRKIEVTAQEAARLGGHLVCPQCLARVDVAVPKPTAAAVAGPPATPKPRQQAQTPAAGGRFCPKCGAKVRDTDAFCKSCGASLGATRRKSDVGTPPPYRSQRRAAAPAPAYRAPLTVARPSVPRQASARRPSSRSEAKASTYVGGLGCMWRTAVGVAVAFALYAMLGLAFQ